MMTLHTPPTPDGHLRRHRRAAIRLLQAVLALSTLLLLVTGCSTPSTSTSDVPAPKSHTQTVHEAQVHLTPTPTFSTSVQSKQTRLFTFAPSNVGLMQPAVDTHGQVWVGEMHANRLGRLNVQTGVVNSWEPPGGRYGIMTTTVDAQGNIWFAELYANYLGRFDPQQQTFHLFPLGTWQGSPLGPRDLHVDGKGMLWFTAMEAAALGRLDPSTGTIRLWPLPSSPSTLTLTPSGRVWFGAAGAVGSLDPAMGQITLYRLPNQQAQVFSMALDTSGRLWFTEVLPGKLGMLDPVTDTMTELAVPTLWGDPPALYQLVVDHQGNIWCVDVSADALVRYAPGKHTLLFFRLSLPKSAPFGLTLDPAGMLWFTAGGSSGNYVGELAP
jgi:virginiamycin B lyase